MLAEQLLFDKEERDQDGELRLQLEAISRLDEAEKHVVMEVLDGLLLKHDAKRWTTRENTG